MQSELKPRLPCPTNAYVQRQNQIVQVGPRNTITSRNRGNLDRSFPRGRWTKRVISFKAGHLLRFAAALVAMSNYAWPFSADAQVSPDIASRSPSVSATPTLNLGTPVMPGDTPPLVAYAPPVGPFEQEVTSLENRRIELPQRPIVFYGSSSIRRWKTLSEDFVGYPVVNCGFGGSRLTDCVRYLPRLVLRLKPAAVVVYAGDNDLAQGALPDQVFASFRALYTALRGYSEQMPIAYISVKPCPARIRYIDNILRFNQMVQAFLQTQPSTKYIDIYPAMLGRDHKPNPALFVRDQIHLSDLGYQILRRDVSSFLTSEIHP
jgi:lysophospholipase L1-like esterase